MLPLSDLARTEEKKEPVRNLILYEPSAEEVFDAIVPEYLAGLIYGGVCESQASELAGPENGHGGRYRQCGRDDREPEPVL